MHCTYCGTQQTDSAEICFKCRKPLPTFVGEGSVIGGRYEIHGMLGRGGMGAVYKAFDQALKENIAIKILRPDLGELDELAERFRSEIKLARKVRHRNVCAIHDYGEDGPLHFISMELVEGVDLRELLRKRGMFPPEEALDISIQVCQGLEAIHAAKIVHRDLKPQNLMLQSDGVVRLMDFGIAKRLGGDTTGQTRTGQVIGTPRYMSPEQARGEKVDFGSDIYSAGIVIFEFFTGTVPFEGDTPEAAIMQHLREPPALEGEAARALPPGLVPILRKVLAKDTAARPENISELLQQLASTPKAPQAAAVQEEETVELSESNAPVNGVTVTLDREPMPPEPTPHTTHLESKVVPPPSAEAQLPARVDRPRSTPAAPATRQPSVPTTPRPRRRTPVPVTRSNRGPFLVAAGVTMSLVMAGLFAVVYSSWRSAGQGDTRPSGSTAAPEKPLGEDDPSEFPRRPLTETDTRQAASSEAFTPRPARSHAPPEPREERGDDRTDDSVSMDAAARLTPTPPDVGQEPRTARTPPLTAETTPVPSPVSATPAPDPTSPPQGRDEGVALWENGTTPTGERKQTVPTSLETATPAPRTTPEVATGTLSVLITPWAKVVVDGKDMGTTPIAPVKLQVGEHTVVLANPEYEPVKRVVMIEAGEATDLEVNLTFEAFPRKRR